MRAIVLAVLVVNCTCEAKSSGTATQAPAETTARPPASAAVTAEQPDDAGKAKPAGQVVAQRPAVPFPEAAAGFPFGETPEKASARCRAAGGSAVTVPKKKGERPSVACGATPVGIGIDIEVIFLEFCDGALCEVILTLGKELGRRRLDQLNSVESKVEGKYGPPTSVVSDTATALGRCGNNLPGKMQHAWMVPNTPERPGGRIVLAYNCGDASDAGTGTLTYQSAEGVRWRLRELDRKNENFLFDRRGAAAWLAPPGLERPFRCARTSLGEEEAME
jgi:hypothetical protein